MPYPRTLHEQLTNLLMENGASVSKPSIDALIKFIASRDKDIIDGIKENIEEIHRQLQENTYLYEKEK